MRATPSKPTKDTFRAQIRPGKTGVRKLRRQRTPPPSAPRDSHRRGVAAKMAGASARPRRPRTSRPSSAPLQQSSGCTPLHRPVAPSRKLGAVSLTIAACGTNRNAEAKISTLLGRPKSSTIAGRCPTKSFCQTVASRLPAGACAATVDTMPPIGPMAAGDAASATALSVGSSAAAAGPTPAIGPTDGATAGSATRGDERAASVQILGEV